MLSPAFSEFNEKYQAGVPQIVWRKIVSDLETPVSGYIKLGAQRPYSFLLESVEGGEHLGRYSIIGFKPDIIWRSVRDVAEINENAIVDAYAFRNEEATPLESLKNLLAASRIDISPGLPPMAAGVFGYLGYDMARQMERLPERRAETEAWDAVFIRPTMTAIFDNIRQEITLTTPVRPAKKVSARIAYSQAEERLSNAVKDLSASLPIIVTDVNVEQYAHEIKSNTPKGAYLHMVAKAKDYIAAGDIFQVVLSQRFEAPFEAEPFELYRALRRTNPSPFLFYLNFDDYSLVGSSPEILVRVRNGEVTIRPIAGTRPRGTTPEEDLANERELLADPKERAEHLMLLDLGRNDVGRSSLTGSVRVTESFAVERYSHVMHIVSNVIGRLAPYADAVDAVIAGFPAGTVTGAPKIRAMEIIDELERDSRGPYGGAIGYFSADGSMDTCIALRTALVKNGVMQVQAGAGIVIDSDPDSEYTECLNKAKALFAAADAALQRPKAF